MEKINGRLQLKNVTLVAMTSVNIDATIDAMLYSMREIDFKDVVLITHELPKNLPDSIRYEHIDILDNIDKFNYNGIFLLFQIGIGLALFHIGVGFLKCL